MKLPRRNFLHLAAGAAALPDISRVARAQAYPSRPMRIVVGFAPGGPADIVARLIAQWLSERLGQQFVVENRPGAGTNIGTEAVVTAPADSYMLQDDDRSQHTPRAVPPAAYSTPASHIGSLAASHIREATMPSVRSASASVIVVRET